MAFGRHIISVIFSAALAVSPSASAATATVDSSVTHQLIRGFGGVNGWRPPLAAEAMDLLFGNEAGQIGLTIYRVRIAPDGNWGEEATHAQLAAARGATIIATPWTPPATMKTNGNIIGGSLRPDAYAAYAEYLNSYTRYLADQGVSLYAISLQNEPDWDPDYEGCVWTAQNFLTFCRDHAGAITGTRVIMPESLNFRRTLSDPTLNDPTAAANVDIVGGHIYGGGLNKYPLPFEKGKEVWMTEHLELTTDWAGAMQTAREIHDCLAIADHSAYLWWYLKRFYGPLGEDDVVTKRGYVMSQFSKFIRPGYRRIEATQNPTPGVYVSAYRGPRTVIVAINSTASDVVQAFAVQNGAPATFTPWATSSTLNVAEQPALAVAGGAFSATLPASSITTFVENLPAAGPVFTAQPASRSVAAGASANFLAAATVPGGPGETTFAWQHNGYAVAASAAALTRDDVQPADAGLYHAVASSGSTSAASEPAILGIATTTKIVGAGDEIASDIEHPNGNVFDQILVTGAAETIVADHQLGQITRTSFIDLEDNIVQVEFSGPGSLSIVLDAPSGPARPVNYNQDVSYMKGHAGIVIAGATENTHVTIFSVGRATAVDAGLFRDDVDYGGVAGIAFLAILSTDGKFGGVRTANVNYFASRGFTGLYAPRVTFLGPVYLGNVTAFDDATPVIHLGSASDVRITGGDLAQANERPVQVRGVAHLAFTAGTDSHGHELPAQVNRATLLREGIDVTAETLAVP